MHAGKRPRSSSAQSTSGRTRVDGKACRMADWQHAPMSVYEVHLGSWQRGAKGEFLNYRELADNWLTMSRAWASPTSSYCRSPSIPSTSVVGLSGNRLFRPDQPFWHAGRLSLLRRPLPPERDRRDSRLGSGAFPQGCFCPRALRRHGALRARGPAQGRAPRLVDADLQLRSQRGPKNFLVSSALYWLARNAPRRTARRRRRIDALPRLFA
jgi:hypothetical protein